MKTNIVVPLSIILRIKIFQTEVAEKIKTHLMFNNFHFIRGTI
jgi:hypothetical protein